MIYYTNVDDRIDRQFLEFADIIAFLARDVFDILHEVNIVAGYF